MSTLNDLINLAKADGGKFFVIDEKGEPQLVIMGIDDYQKLLLGKIKREVEDVEQINRQIIEAQLSEKPIVPPAPAPVVAAPKVEIRQPEIRKAAPAMVDMREEVIDPSFDFEGPKIELDDL